MLTYIESRNCMKKMLDKLKRSSIHFIVWSVFIIYETLIVGLIFDIFENPVTYLFHYIVIIVFFYCFSDLGLPWSFRKNLQAFWRLPLIILLSLATYVFFHYVTNLLLIYINVITVRRPYHLDQQFILKNIYRGIYFMFFSIGYFVFKKTQVEKREKEQLKKLHLHNIIKQQKTEQELVRSHNSMLKAQIAPHFLFNTLDFIYHTMEHNVQLASDAVIHLSRIMRFAIDSDHMGEVIPLGAEIKHVETLFSLYQLRNTKTVIRLNYSPEIVSLPFIPLVLLTLAENMIKHGEFSDPQQQAVVNFLYKNDTLTITTRNMQTKNINIHSGKSGLDNIKKRLEYKYGTQVSLKYSVLNDVFILILIVPGIKRNHLSDDTNAPDIPALNISNLI